MPTATIVNSVLRSAEILKVLSDGIDRISDLSSRLNLSKSTTHRFLKSLEASGFVTQDPVTRRYYLGSLVLDLASKPIIAHQKLIVASFDEMKYLRDLTRETVVLHIRIGLERICLEELQSLEGIRYTCGKGVVAPIHTGAGKILLSEMEDDNLQLVLKNIRLSKVGPNTITDKGKLLEELKKTREQGYATSFSERIPGSSSISVPIRHYVCPVALTVMGPDSRFSFDVMHKFLNKIKERASRISKNIAEMTQEG
jgi:DNA-binding IclR family transcriptional regulator